MRTIPNETSATVIAAANDFRRYCLDTLRLLDLTENGARSIIAFPRFLDEINEVINDDPTGATSADPEREARMSERRKSAEMAQAEIERGFPLLHSHALMGIWGALKSAVDDACLAHALANPGVLAEGKLAKVKVNAVDFLALDEPQRIQLILAEGRRLSASSLRIGVAQFEYALEDVGLDGAIDENIRNTLRIAKAMRNVIAHRAGKIDRRLVEDCPDLELKHGDALRISKPQIYSVVMAAIMYLLTIANRSRKHAGEEEKSIDIFPIDSRAELVKPFRPGWSPDDWFMSQVTNKDGDESATSSAD